MELEKDPCNESEGVELNHTDQPRFIWMLEKGYIYLIIATLIVRRPILQKKGRSA